MSPLFLLFSLFGAGVFTMLGPRSDTDTTSTPATKTPQSSPTVGEEPVIATIRGRGYKLEAGVVAAESSA